jgi:hypothetical protein
MRGASSHSHPGCGAAARENPRLEPPRQPDFGRRGQENGRDPFLFVALTDPRDQEDLSIALHYLRSHNISRTARAMQRDRKTVTQALARVELQLRSGWRRRAAIQPK